MRGGGSIAQMYGAFGSFSSAFHSRHFRREICVEGACVTSAPSPHHLPKCNVSCLRMYQSSKRKNDAAFGRFSSVLFSSRNSEWGAQVTDPEKWLSCENPESITYTWTIRCNFSLRKVPRSGVNQRQYTSWVREYSISCSHDHTKAPKQPLAVQLFREWTKQRKTGWIRNEKESGKKKTACRNTWTAKHVTTRKVCASSIFDLDSIY